MNNNHWDIGIKMWWRGFLIFCIGLFILCAISLFVSAGSASFEAFPIAFAVIIVSVLLSWPAIIIYAFWLKFANSRNLTVNDSMATLYIIPTTISVGIAVWLLRLLTSCELNDENFLFSLAFWPPLLCCIIAVGWSKKDIAAYLQPQEIITKLPAN